jgi:hypothetical protein
MKSKKPRRYLLNYPQAERQSKVLDRLVHSYEEASKLSRIYHIYTSCPVSPTCCPYATSSITLVQDLDTVVDRYMAVSSTSHLTTAPSPYGKLETMCR